jgi:hypothetical protein
VFPRSPVLEKDTKTVFPVVRVPPEDTKVQTRVVPAVAPEPPVLPEVIEKIVKFAEDAIDEMRIYPFTTEELEYKVANQVVTVFELPSVLLSPIDPFAVVVLLKVMLLVLTVAELTAPIV